MSRSDDFNRITKDVPVRRVERAFNLLMPGIDWRDSGRPAVRKAYSEGLPLYAASGLSITPEKLEAAISADASGDPEQMRALIDQRDAAPGVPHG